MTAVVLGLAPALKLGYIRSARFLRCPESAVAARGIAGKERRLRCDV